MHGGKTKSRVERDRHRNNLGRQTLRTLLGTLNEPTVHQRIVPRGFFSFLFLIYISLSYRRLHSSVLYIYTAVFMCG
jgi:hypothetical protein